MRGLEREANIMDELEKVEKLRERANVSYEEAKEALEKSNGDLLDAIVYLERQGKVKAPEQTTYSTEAASQPDYADVPAIVKESEQRTAEESLGTKFGRTLKKIGRYLSENHLKVEHGEKKVVEIPLWVALIAILLTWWFMLILIIISLFCDYRYSVVGNGKNEEVNKVMEKASEFTGQVKDEFKKN